MTKPGCRPPTLRGKSDNEQLGTVNHGTKESNPADQQADAGAQELEINQQVDPVDSALKSEHKPLFIYRVAKSKGQQFSCVIAR